MQDTILVVDDEQMLRAFYQEVLSASGYRVTTAKSAEEALATLEREYPRLIVADVNMGVMDGFDLCREVRERMGDRAPAFIFLSALGGEENIVKGLTLGADDFITKPVSAERLLLKVKSILRRTATGAQPAAGADLAGTLARQSLADVLQFLSQSQRTGCLEVRTEGKQASIFLRDGRVVWAQFPPLAGEDAVYAVLALTEGDFELRESAEPPAEANVTTPPTELLLEGMRRLDEGDSAVLLKAVFGEGTAGRSAAW